jgi:hypothetical protein
MCNCCKSGYLTYAALYNSAIKERDRYEWVREQLQLAKQICYVRRFALACHLHKMLQTQQLFEKTPTPLRRDVLALYTQMHIAKSIRTRRLATRMLRHTYRPYCGRMFLKGMRVALGAQE